MLEMYLPWPAGTTKPFRHIGEQYAHAYLGFFYRRESMLDEAMQEFEKEREIPIAGDPIGKGHAGLALLGIGILFDVAQSP